MKQKINRNRPTRFYSNKQEKQVAKVLHGKQVSNSGATEFNKGDVTLDDWLIECKTSIKEKSTFTIHKEWFKKNEEEAFSMGKNYSALVFDFGDDERHYVINEKLFKKLISALEGENFYGNSH